jgi:hypothetical protein
MPRLPKFGIALGAVTLGVGGIWIAWEAIMGKPAGPPPKPAPPGHAGEVVPELVRLEPGAVIGDGPPTGWSHRVIKTTLELATGDLDTLPAFAKETATRFRTLLMADVRRSASGAGHALGRVGVGMAVAHRGGDIVVSSSNVDSLGDELSILDRLVLSRAEEALDRGRLAARTPTFALYDASVEIADGDKHRSAFLRYGFLVDPGSGALRTVVWPIAEDPAKRRPPEEMILITPSLEFRCGIHVKAQRALGQVPVSWFFAMTGLPTGEAVRMPEDLRAWSTRDPRDAYESGKLEGLLRRALDRPEAELRRPPR